MTRYNIFHTLIRATVVFAAIGCGDANVDGGRVMDGPATIGPSERVGDASFEEEVQLACDSACEATQECPTVRVAGDCAETCVASHDAGAESGEECARAQLDRLNCVSALSCDTLRLDDETECSDVEREVLAKCATPLSLHITAPNSSANVTSFVHTATATNTIHSLTTVDNPIVRYNPELALFVDYRISDDEDFRHPLAVSFHVGRGWQIISADSSPIPAGTQFNVISMPRNNASGTVYVHKNRSRGQIAIYTGRDSTKLSHPALNGNPNAKILVSHYWPQDGSSPGRFNAHPIATYYESGAWHIVNTDGARMPRDVIFFVFFGPEMGSVSTQDRFGHKAYLMDNEVLNQNPDGRVLATRVIKNRGERTTNLYHGHFYNTTSIEGRRGEEQWLLSTTTGTPDPTEGFSVLAHDQLRNGRYRVYTQTRAGWSLDYANGLPPVMEDPLTAKDAAIERVAAAFFRANGDLAVFEIDDDDADAAVVRSTAGGQSLSKYIENRFDQKVGVITLSDGHLVTARLDYNLDGVVDHVARHNLMLGVSQFYVAETVEALERWDDILAGRNVFCTMGEAGLGEASRALLSLGGDTPSSATIPGCASKGKSSDSGFGLDRTLPRGNGSAMERMCQAYFAGGGASGGPEFMAGDITGNDIVSVVRAIGGFGSALRSRNPIDVVKEYVGLVHTLDSIRDRELRAEVGARASALRHAAAGMRRKAAEFSQLANSESDSAAAQRLRAIASDMEEEAELYERVADAVETVPDAVPSLDPGPSPDGSAGSPDADWGRRCEHYLANQASYSLDSLEKAMAQADCPNPVAGVPELVSSTGGGTRPTPVGPFQPDLGRRVNNDLFCRDSVEYPTLGDAMSTMCNSPVTQPGLADNRACQTQIMNSSAGTLQISAGGVVAPRFEEDLTRMLEKVTNPGGPR